MIWNGIFPLVSSSNKFVIWVHFPDFTLHVLHCDCCTWAHHDAETTYRSSSPNLCTSVLSAPPLSHLVPSSLSPFNSRLLDLVAPFLLSCSPPLSYFFARPLLLMRKWKHRYISHLRCGACTAAQHSLISDNLVGFSAVAVTAFIVVLWVFCYRSAGRTEADLFRVVSMLISGCLYVFTYKPFFLSVCHEGMHM